MNKTKKTFLFDVLAQLSEHDTKTTATLTDLTVAGDQIYIYADDKTALTIDELLAKSGLTLADADMIQTKHAIADALDADDYVQVVALGQELLRLSQQLDDSTVKTIFDESTQTPVTVAQLKERLARAFY